MSKKNINDDLKSVLDEIDAFIENEKTPKKTRKKMDKVEIKEVVTPDVPKKRGRRKKEDIQDIVTKEVSKEEVIEEEIEEFQEVENILDEVDEEEVEIISDIDDEDDEDDDLYITRSFKPLKKKKRLKKSIIKFIKFIIILAILSILGYFAWVNLYKVYYNSRPVNIIKNTIEYIGDEIVEKLEYIDFNDDAIFEFDVDTNIKKYEYLNDVKFGYAYWNEDNYQDLVYVNNINNVKVGRYTSLDGKKYNVSYLNSDAYYVTENDNSEIRNIIKYLSNNGKKIDEVILGNVDIFKELVKEEYINVKDEELYINGSTIAVKCNSLVINEDNRSKLYELYMDELFEDEKLLNDMADAFNNNVEKMKRLIKDYLSTLDKDFTINVYTNNLYNVVGFDYEIDGFIVAYYYKNGNDIEVSIKIEEYINKLLNKFDFDIKNGTNVGIIGDDSKGVKVSLDKEDKFNLVLKEFTDKKISFEYKNLLGTKVNDVVINKDGLVIEYKNNTGKYLDINMKIMDNNENILDITKRELYTSSKKINDIKDEELGKLNKEEKDVYSLITDVFYNN